MTMAWGVVIVLYLPDGPHNGKMFSKYERVVAVWRISRNQTGLKNSKFQWHQVKEALLDPKTYLLLVMASAFGILNGGVANFMSALIGGLGFDPLRTSLLQTPGGAIEVVACMILGYISTLKNMTGITIMSTSFPHISLSPSLSHLLISLIFSRLPPWYDWPHWYQDISP